MQGRHSAAPQPSWAIDSDAGANGAAIDPPSALRNHIQMVRKKLVRVQAGDAPVPDPAALVSDKVQSAS